MLSDSFSRGDMTSGRSEIDESILVMNTAGNFTNSFCSMAVLRIQGYITITSPDGLINLVTIFAVCTAQNPNKK